MINKRVVLFMSLLFLWPALPKKTSAAELKPKTLQAWNKYIEVVESGLKDVSVALPVFLHVDKDPRSAASIEAGNVLIEPVIRNGSQTVPEGLIHHWKGITFIPHTTIDQVMAVTRDYGRYKQYFNPAVIQSEVIRKSDQFDEYSLLWAAKVMFISAGVDTQCRTHYVRLDDNRVYQTSSTTRVQEIEDYGKPGERRLPLDHGNGFIWRLYTVTRYEARDGGVFIEVQAIALTREIPGSVRFLVTPVVKKISQNSLRISLNQTRAAVVASNDTSHVALGILRSPKPSSGGNVKSFVDGRSQ